MRSKWPGSNRTSEKRDELASLHEAFPSETQKMRPPENQGRFEIAI